MNRLLVAALLAAAALLPTVAAQSPPTGLTLAVTDLKAPIPYAGTAALNVTVTAGCADLVTNNGATAVTVTIASPPAWLTVTPASIALNPQDCVTSGTGFMPGAGSIGLTVSKDAPGVIENTLAVTATWGSTMPPTKNTVVTVAYHPEYSLKADVIFPYTMTKPTVTFNLTVTQNSNARSMVMMEEVKSTAGVVSGLASVVYTVPETKVFKITYKAPDSAWNTTTVSFKGYSHYLLLDSRAGPFDAGTPMKWEFHNGGIKPANAPAKKSPAPVGAFLGLGLVGLAALLRRKD